MGTEFGELHEKKKRIDCFEIHSNRQVELFQTRTKRHDLRASSCVITAVSTVQFWIHGYGLPGYTEDIYLGRRRILLLAKIEKCASSKRMPILKYGSSFNSTHKTCTPSSSPLLFKTLPRASISKREKERERERLQVASCTFF